MEVLFGPYETLSRIAAGGMGEVFVARRTGAGEFEKKVALKVLLPHLSHDREFVERFFDEARLVARMNHPNIVHIFDVGETDGRPWLAMALVEAVSLARLQHELIARNERLALPLVRLIATGLLEGLAYAHALTGPKGEPLNVVHRDISPSNLLVSTDGAVLLTDFGIAKASINLHRTQPGRLRGKLSYLAPETLAGESVDQRSDLFSAGVTLFQLVTGTSPFLMPTDTETMDAVKKAQAPRVQSLRSDVTAGLAAALHRALERQPSARFASARQMRGACCDGPVASAPELGEAVRRLCAKSLATFKDLNAGPSSGPGTSSLPSITQPSHPPGRLWPVLLAAFVVTFAGGSALLLLGTPTEAPVTSPPAVTAAAVEPVGPRAVETGPAPVTPAPDPEPEPVRVATVKPSPPVRVAPRPPPGPSKRPSVEPLRVGFLTADASPWANVFLDGQALDRTPLSRFPVPSGAHTLTFKSSDGRQVVRPVNIEEGQVQVVRVEFAREP